MTGRAELTGNTDHLRLSIALRRQPGNPISDVLYRIGIHELGANGRHLDDLSGGHTLGEL